MLCLSSRDIIRQSAVLVLGGQSGVEERGSIVFDGCQFGASTFYIIIISTHSNRNCLAKLFWFR